MNKNFVSSIIIQARMHSTRFPGKVMSFLGGFPLIEYVYRRSQLSKLKNILVATSDNSSDDILYNYCKKNNMPVVRGDLHNVLERYIKTAESIRAKYIIRICADTPFVDIDLCKRLLEILIIQQLDYVSLDRLTCAAGFYSEAVTLQALKSVSNLTNDKEDLEHVTKFIINHKDKFLIKFLNADLNPEFIKNTRLTIDFPKDIHLANKIVNELPDKFSFTSQDILEIICKNITIHKNES